VLYVDCACVRLCQPCISITIPRKPASESDETKQLDLILRVVDGRVGARMLCKCAQIHSDKSCVIATRRWPRAGRLVAPTLRDMSCAIAMTRGRRVTFACVLVTRCLSVSLSLSLSLSLQREWSVGLCSCSHFEYSRIPERICIISRT
jgi:hypothetical protein